MLGPPENKRPDTNECVEALVGVERTYLVHILYTRFLTENKLKILQVFQVGYNNFN